MATKEKIDGHKGKSGPKTGGHGSKHRGAGKMPPTHMKGKHKGKM